jgi:hypothetical protein
VTSTVLNTWNGRTTEEIVHGITPLGQDLYRLLAVGHNEALDVWLETLLYSDETAVLLASPVAPGADLGGREVSVSLSMGGQELWRGLYTAAPGPEDPDPVRDLVGALVSSMETYDRHRTTRTDAAIKILVDWLGY